MYSIKNYHSNGSIPKQPTKRVNSKSTLRSTSEVKQQIQEQPKKPNYHYSQKRELSEGKQRDETIDSNKKQAQNHQEQVKEDITSQLKHMSKEELLLKQQVLTQALNDKINEFKLPDLRKYQNKPPKVLPPIQQNIENVKKEITNEKTQSNKDLTQSMKPPLSVSQANQHQLKSRLIMYDDPLKSRVRSVPKQTEQPAQSQQPNQKQLCFNIASLSKAGFDGYNQKTNQDRELLLTKSKNSGSYGVFDGHGQEGDKVSQFIVNTLKDILQTQFDSFDYVKMFPELHSLLKQHPTISSQFSGSTCTLMILKENQLSCGWLGDSRAIMGRRRSTRKIDPIEITKDHKCDLQEERLRIEKAGGQVDSYHSITGAQLGPFRVWVKGAGYPGLAMSRSLGDQVAASVGVSQIPGTTFPQYINLDVTNMELTDDDLFIIIASDGIWEFMSNQKVVDIVYQYYLKNDPKGACQQLYTESYNIWKSFDDGIDDITSVVIFLNRE